MCELGIGRRPNHQYDRLRNEMHIEMLCFFDQSHGNLGFALPSCPVTFGVTKSKTEITNFQASIFLSSTTMRKKSMLSDNPGLDGAACPHLLGLYIVRFLFVPDATTMKAVVASGQIPCLSTARSLGASSAASSHY